MAQRFRPTLAHSRDTVPVARPLLRWAPPSGAMINVVLQYADIQTDMGGGRVMLRLSPERRSDPVITDALGREAPRLADVAILWDEDEGEIVRVLDSRADAGTALSVVEPVTAWDDEPGFEITEAGQAYIDGLFGER